MSLRRKTIRGLAWSGTSQFGRQLSQFIVTAVLARLLSPDDFGLLAMAMVFVNFILIFNQMGIAQALIQKQDTQERHYHSTFWLNIFVGIALTLVTIAAAPLIARFYRTPKLEPILIVISLDFFISSFIIIQQTILTKEMDFKKLAVRDIGAVIFAGAVGIVMAYKGFGVWSLVAQTLTLSLGNALLLWTVSPWRPKFHFSLTDIKDIFRFGAHMTGFQTVNYLARNIDQLLIGRFLGPQALGYYSLAYKLMMLPMNNISWVISRVMYPAFSKIQHDLRKVRENYLKLAKAISLASFPLMTGLFAVAPEFVRVVYGNQWEPTILIIRIFCFCGMVRSINTIVGNIILSQGKSGLQLRLGLWGAFYAASAVLIGLRWGIPGVAICYTIQQVLWWIYTQTITDRLIGLSTRSFFLMMGQSFLVGLCMLAVMPVASFIGNDTIALILAVSLGIGIYIGILFLKKEIFIKGKHLKVRLLSY